MLEQPFIYVYDADRLTDGSSYSRTMVNLNSDAPFHLRRVSGRNFVSANLRLYDANSNFVQSAAIVAPRDYPLIPEMVYPKGSQIQFDLGTVARSSRAYAAGGSVPNYYSQLSFQGAKVFSDRNPPTQTPYKWKPRFYQYTQDMTIDYTGRVAPAYTDLANFKRFSLEMRDFDFEMCAIDLLITLNGQTVPAISDTYVKIKLYDQFQDCLMSAPVLDSFLNFNSATNNSIFPTPTVLFPVGSFIVLDIYSLLVESQVPATLNVTYTGYWRVPC